MWKRLHELAVSSELADVKTVDMMLSTAISTAPVAARNWIGASDETVRENILLW